MHAGLVHRRDIAGAWWIKQINTNADFTTAAKTEMKNAFAAIPGRGIGVRTKASTYCTADGVFDHTLIEEAKNLADEIGCELSVRIMFGEHTSPFVFSGLGCRSWINSNGKLCPHPCKTSGAPNDIFEAYVADLWTDLKSLSVLLGIKIDHVSWYSNKYAEPFLDSNCMFPVAGYDAANANAQAAYKGLLDIAFSLADDDVSFEFASSGTYPSGFMSPVLAYGRTLFGDYSPLLYIQENGIPNFFGLGNPFISPGGQMFQPGNLTPAQWAALFANRVIPDKLEYVEFYTNAFGGTGAAFTAWGGSGSTALKQQLAVWVPTLIEPPVIPPDDPGGLIPVDLGFTNPGPIAAGPDGQIYVATRPSAGVRPTLWKGKGSSFAKISDGPYEANANIPLAIAVDDDGRVLVGTQGAGVLVGTLDTDPGGGGGGGDPGGGDPGVGGGPSTDPTYGNKLEVAFGAAPYSQPAEEDYIDVFPDCTRIWCHRGKAHELGRTQTAEIVVELLDRTRKYDRSNPSGPYAGMLTSRTPMRWVAGGRRLVQGLTEKWPRKPYGRHVGGQGVIAISMTGSDVFKLFGTQKVQNYPAAVLADGPKTYLRLADPAGSTTVADVQAPTAPWTVDLAAVDLGYSPGAIGNSTQADFQGVADSAPISLSVAGSSGPPTPGDAASWRASLITDATFELILWPRSLADGDGLFLAQSIASSGTPKQARLRVNADGSITWDWNPNISSPSVFDGGTSPAGLLELAQGHRVAMVRRGFVIEWYQDGQLFGTSPFTNRPAVVAGPSAGSLELVIGAHDRTTGATYDGRAAQFALYPRALDPGRIATHAAATLDTSSTATTAGEQIAAIAAAAGMPAGRILVDPDGSLMQPLVGSEIDVQDMILSLGEESDQGLVFIRADGVLRYISRQGLTVRNAASLAVLGDSPGEIAYSDPVEISDEDNDLWPIVQITREGGLTQTAIDNASVAQWGPSTLENAALGRLLNTDEDAAALAAFLLNRYHVPLDRPKKIVLQPGSSAAKFQQIIERDLGDHITVVYRPPGGGDPQVLEAQIEEITHEWTSPKGWETTWGLVPAPSSTVWIAGRSALGEDTYAGWGGDPSAPFADLEMVGAGALNTQIRDPITNMAQAHGFRFGARMVGSGDSAGATGKFGVVFIGDDGTFTDAQWFDTDDLFVNVTIPGIGTGGDVGIPNVGKRLGLWYIHVHLASRFDNANDTFTVRRRTGLASGDPIETLATYRWSNESGSNAHHAAHVRLIVPVTDSEDCIDVVLDEEVAIGEIGSDPFVSCYIEGHWIGDLP